MCVLVSKQNKSFHMVLVSQVQHPARRADHLPIKHSSQNNRKVLRAQRGLKQDGDTEGWKRGERFIEENLLHYGLLAGWWGCSAWYHLKVVDTDSAQNTFK